jgi:hypothetical protein
VCVHFLFGGREDKNMPKWFRALNGDVEGLQRFLDMEKITIKSFAMTNTEQRPKDFRPFFAMSCLASTAEPDGHVWLDCHKSGANLLSHSRQSFLQMRGPVLHDKAILTCV